MQEQPLNLRKKIALVDESPQYKEGNIFDGVGMGRNSALPLCEIEKMQIWEG